MEATCLKAGSSVAFTDALFRLKSDKQKILVRGKQQLAILRDPSRIKQKLPVKTDAKTTVVEKKAMENGVKNAEMLAKKKKFDNIEDDDLEVTAKVTDTSLLDKMQQIFRTIGAQDNYYQIVKNVCFYTDLQNKKITMTDSCNIGRAESVDTKLCID